MGVCCAGSVRKGHLLASECTMQRESDVIVVGAGPAGACAALALQRRGLATTLIDRSTRPRWKIGETLAPGAAAALEAIDLASIFDDGRHLPSHGTTSAWGASTLESSEFIFRPDGCGWQLDRARFEASLIDAARRAGAYVMAGQNVLTLRRQHDAWEVKTIESIVRAAYLVDASGRARVAARRLNVRHFAVDRLVSLHLRLSGPSDPDRDAHTLVESTPDGWWYTALTPGDARVASLQTDADLLSKDSWRKADWMREQIEMTTHLFELLTSKGYRLTAVPMLTSARSSRLEHFFGEGWIAAGDAALAFDPLCGRGMLMAIQTGVMAADAIAAKSAQAMDAYGTALDLAWSRYLGARSAYYQDETRWPDRPFWKRRHRSARQVASLSDMPFDANAGRTMLA